MSTAGLSPVKEKGLTLVELLGLRSLPAKERRSLARRTPGMISALVLLVVAQDRPEPEWLPVLEAPAGLTHVLTIPPNAQSGPRIQFRGRVLKADRKTPVPNVVVYFHHTNGSGVYPRRAGSNPRDWAHWHGYLRGWLKTDAQGRYVLNTTKPAPYPGRTEPAHIHVYGLLPGSRTGVSFPAYLFEGDPNLTESYWRRYPPEDEYRFSRLRADGTGVLKGERDLIIPRS